MATLSLVADFSGSIPNLMPLGTISLKRSLTSYAKVQAVIGPWIRNRRFQLRRPRVRRLEYLDIGCGENPHEALINLDYLWHPKVDVCWDVTRGLPFPDRSMRGVFSEHCLEHFDLNTATALLKEMRRLLKPGGTLRLVVPDAELYLRTYVSQRDGKSELRFPYEEEERMDPLWTPLHSVNRVFYQDRSSPFGHCTMYDHQMLRVVLLECGFESVSSCEFGQGRDPALLIESPSRNVESLYVEATVGS